MTLIEFKELAPKQRASGDRELGTCGLVVGTQGRLEPSARHRSGAINSASCLGACLPTSG